MAYTKTVWENAPSTATPINATRLNNIEDGIEALDTRLTTASAYSTTEQIIGKWIDGKPLYRKTLSFKDGISLNTLLTKSHGIDNIGTQWIDNSATFFRSNNKMSYSFPMVGYDSNLTDKTYCYCDATNIYIYSNGGWGTSWTKVITLCYTKTTD